MIRALEGLCSRAGDALVAVGAALRTRREGFSDYEAGDFLLPPAQIPKSEVRHVVDELSDSELLGAAALVIEGWKPILLKTTADATGVDVLVAALRDRADQFRAVERDADCAFLTPAHLGAHLTGPAT